MTRNRIKTFPVVPRILNLVVVSDVEIKRKQKVGVEGSLMIIRLSVSRAQVTAPWALGLLSNRVTYLGDGTVAATLYQIYTIRPPPSSPRCIIRYYPILLTLPSETCRAFDICIRKAILWFTPLHVQDTTSRLFPEVPYSQVTSVGGEFTLLRICVLCK